MRSPPHAMTLRDAVTGSEAFDWLSGRDNPILLAVSGGADSTALTLLFHQLVREERLTVDLVVGHVVHDLRETGPEADRKFVENLARERNLEFETARISIREPVQSRPVSPEAYARRARYDALGRMARKHGCEAVVTAHHRDDQIETLVLRLLRGTGLKGLTGMPARRSLTGSPPDQPESDATGPFLLRPLLNVRKNKLRTYLEKKDQAWRRDPTNEQETYRRNRVRRQLLPAVQRELGASYPDLLLRIRRRASVITDRLKQHWQRSIPPHQIDRELLYVDRSAVIDLSPMLHPYLLRWIRSNMDRNDVRPGYHDLRRLRQLLDHGTTGRQETLSDRLTARLEHDWVVVRDRTGGSSTAPDEPETLEWPPPGQAEWNGWTVNAQPANLPDPYKQTDRFRDDPWRELIDTRTLREPLTIGARQNGDRIRPLGMDGRKKVKDVMIDRRVPASLRNRWPVCRDRKRILWIPGLCLSHVVRVRSDTDPADACRLDCTREKTGAGDLFSRMSQPEVPHG